MKNKENIKTKFKDFATKEKKRLNLLYTMVSRNVKTMYRESVLGIIWTVLNPLLSMFVIAFVYSAVFGTEMEGIAYPVYILSGMIVYGTLFRTGSTMGLSSIVEKRALVLQTQLPITIYPRVAVYTAFVNFFFSFAALVIVMLIYKQPFQPTLLLMFVLLPALLLLTLGVSFIMSTVYVYFRDIRNIYNVLTTLLMYVTPIYYTIERLNNPLVVELLQYNPLYFYVDYFRQAIMGNVPSLEYHLMIYGMGILVYAVGYALITNGKKKFIFHL